MPKAARALFAVLIVLLGLSLLRHQHDIDESQNLHLVYGWLKGEIPYRDRFDNHAPLFTLVFVPMAAFVGETPWVVLFARVAQLPLLLGSLASIFLIARKVSGTQVAWLTILLCLAFADWSLKAIEFRPDVLWMFFWFLGLWFVLRDISFGNARSLFAAGLSFGLALCASIKSTFLLPSLAFGVFVVWAASGMFRKGFVRSVGGGIAAGVVGFLLPVAALVGLFALLGTRAETVWFSLVEVNRLPFEPGRALGAMFGLPVVAAIGWWICRRPAEGSELRAVLFVTAGTYLMALFGFAPEMRKQTFLVVTPLVILLATHAAFSVRPVWLPRLAAAAVLFGFLVHFVFESRLWFDGMKPHRELLAEVIRQVDDGETIADARGETVFADRTHDLAFVEIVTKKIEAGSLPEPDLSELLTSQTSLAIGSLDGLPRALRRHLKKYYLLGEGGRLRVAGAHLRPEFESGRWVANVDLPLPGTYVLVRDGEVERTFEFTPSSEPQLICLGPSGEPASLVWKEAWDDGFRPLGP